MRWQLQRGKRMQKIMCSSRLGNIFLIGNICLKLISLRKHREQILRIRKKSQNICVVGSGIFEASAVPLLLVIDPLSLQTLSFSLHLLFIVLEQQHMSSCRKNWTCWWSETVFQWFFSEEAYRITNDFVEHVVEYVQIGCVLTRSVEDVTPLKDLIDNCCQNSEHLPLIRAGIQRWFTAHAYGLQLVGFALILNIYKNN